MAGENRQTLYDLIMENIRKDHQTVGDKTETEVARWFEQADDQGKFYDIDYANRAQTNWRPIQHLYRVYAWAQAYTSSQHYKDSPELRKAIARALTYWHETHPTSANWYMQQIACPQLMGTILILMRSSSEGLPPELEEKLTGRMKEEGGWPDQKGSQGTAANKISIALHWIYRGCLTKDEKTLSFGIGQAYQPVAFTCDEGIQYDYSYQQHGKQLYIGGYGAEIAEIISKLALYCQYTPYALPEEKLNLLGKFIREAYIPAIRGHHFLYNVLGRGVSRENSLNQTRFIPVLRRMLLLDSGHASVYQAAIDRIGGKETPDYGLTPSNAHFWCSDYTLHQRPEYTFDVRMVSIYTCRNENGNGENLKGYFLTEGATTIVRNGNEYENIFPVWDWSKIPGTTTPAFGQIPLPKQWQNRGTSAFAGGVSDGKYGVSAYAMDEEQSGIHTSARKSWFMFDDEIVCLGAGIHSDSPHNVCTTVNQCLLQDDVFVSAGDSCIRLDRGRHQFDRLSWIRHQGIGYFFDKASNIHIENEKKEGDWKTINNSYTGKPVEKEVLSIWIDHGGKPYGTGYAYTIVPAQPASGPLRYPSNGIRILTNTSDLQAVGHQGLHLLGIVFHRAGTFTCDRFSLKAGAGCVLLLSDMDKKNVNVYISDPSRSRAVITLETNIYGVGGKEYAIAMPVHPDPYAGSTQHYVMNTENLELRKP
jgi:chondroitin AC lyase